MIGTEAGARTETSHLPPVVTVNAAGTSPFVLVCDHASNRLPERYGDLGLLPYQRLMHIAWDPGALAVALQLSDMLDAPLIYSTISRLVIDCNRHHDAVDLCPVVSERTQILANVGMSDTEREYRLASFHRPFHARVEELLEQRARTDEESILVTVHSFTPTYKDLPRPWPIGLIHGVEERYTRALFDALKAEDPGLSVGWNEPYSARNGVTYTLEHHGDRRQLDATMIEIRHNEILEQAGVADWANRLARTLQAARLAMPARRVLN